MEKINITFEELKKNMRYGIDFYGNEFTEFKLPFFLPKKIKNNEYYKHEKQHLKDLYLKLGIKNSTYLEGEIILDKFIFSKYNICNLNPENIQEIDREHFLSKLKNNNIIKFDNLEKISNNLKELFLLNEPLEEINHSLEYHDTYKDIIKQGYYVDNSCYCCFGDKNKISHHTIKDISRLFNGFEKLVFVENALSKNGDKREIAANMISNYEWKNNLPGKKEVFMNKFTNITYDLTNLLH